MEVEAVDVATTEAGSAVDVGTSAATVTTGGVIATGTTAAVVAAGRIAMAVDATRGKFWDIKGAHLGAVGRREGIVQFEIWERGDC